MDNLIYFLIFLITSIISFGLLNFIKKNYKIVIFLSFILGVISSFFFLTLLINNDHQNYEEPPEEKIYLTNVTLFNFMRIT